MRLFQAIGVLVVGVAACTGDSAVLPLTAAPEKSEILTMQITPGALTGSPGTTIPVQATLLRNAIPSATSGVTWRIADPAVASLRVTGGQTAELTFLTSGATSITAAVAGLTTSASVVSFVPPDPNATGALAIESFEVVEYEYPSALGRWFYAPLIKVRETTGLRAAAVTSMRFIIPGISTTMTCRTNRWVEPGKSLDVLPDVYGDYELEFEGAQLAPAVVTAIIDYTDALGNGATIRVQGAIRVGGFPQTRTVTTLYPLNCAPE